MAEPIEPLRKWDPAERISSIDDAKDWLKAFEDDGTPAEFTSALGDVARALGMAQIAKATGIPVKSLFEVLNQHPEPGMTQLAPILEAMGIRLDRHSDAAE
jgi:probable addiction module antidote protein